jgi:F-box interacting protein
MSILPEELITQILFLLPVKPLLRFQCVSKSWLALITDPYFIKIHAETNTQHSLVVESCDWKDDHYPQDYYLVDFSNKDRFGEPVKIFPPLFCPENLSHTSVIGCCNGLICIQKHDYLDCIGDSNYKFVIWNPLIKKHKKLPFEPVDDTHKLRLHVAAFGYDPVNDDYKVLRIESGQFLNSDDWALEGLEVKVYSLKEHSWRRVEDQLPYKEESFIFSEPAFLNGTFHWLVEREPGIWTLLTFDLATEKFGVQTIPLQPYNVNLDVSLKVLGGSLCISTHIDVWIMKEYGVASSWSRLCKLPMNSCSLVFSEDNEKVLMKKDSFKKKFFWYDIKKKTLRIVKNDRQISNEHQTACLEGGSLLFLLDGDSDN